MIYLVPSFLSENATETIPPYVLEAVKDCQVIFAENERTTRRFLKLLDREIVIDNFEWVGIHKAEEAQINIFRQKIKEGKNIAIVSEAGCPGVADPGQILIAEAQKMNAIIKPLVGPSSILLALMASGLNGQQFYFHGYLPIDNGERFKKIKEMEDASIKKNCTQIFIETPFRNNKIIEAIVQHCQPTTLLCIAAEITASTEWIKTKTIAEWKKETIDLHKKPVIYLLKGN